MKQYMTVRYNPFHIEEINILAAEGWRLVQIFPAYMGGEAILEREVPVGVTVPAYAGTTCEEAPKRRGRPPKEVGPEETKERHLAS